MKVKHVAILGLGSIGKRHLRLLRNLRPDLEISIVRSGFGLPCEEEKLANNVLANHQELVKAGVDAAIISTPSPFHIKEARILAEAGIHLLIEKPLSDQLDGIEEFKKSIEEAKIIIIVGYVLRYREDALYFKSLIDELPKSELSEVFIKYSSYLPDWRPGVDYRKSVSANSSLGGGVLLELSHELDYMNWIFGEAKILRAELQSDKLNLDVEESADIDLVNADNIPIEVHLDFISRSIERYCLVKTKRKEIRWDLVKQEVIVSGTESEKSRNFKFDYDEPYIQQLDCFFKCVEENWKPRVSLQYGIDVLRLVSLAKESYAAKQELHIK